MRGPGIGATLWSQIVSEFADRISSFRSGHPFRSNEQRMVEDSLPQMHVHIQLRMRLMVSKA